MTRLRLGVFPLPLSRSGCHFPDDDRAGTGETDGSGTTGASSTTSTTGASGTTASSATGTSTGTASTTGSSNTGTGSRSAGGVFGDGNPARGEAFDDGNLGNDGDGLDACQPATCDDGFANRGEGDFDCGGPFPEAYPNGASCQQGDDGLEASCVSGTCTCEPGDDRFGTIELDDPMESVAAGDPTWMRQWGSDGRDNLMDVAVGPDGDVFAVGQTTGDVFAVGEPSGASSGRSSATSRTSSCEGSASCSSAAPGGEPDLAPAARRC